MGSAGCFKDDARDPARGEPCKERAVALGVLVEAAGLTAGAEAGVEVVFADVDIHSGS